MPEVQELTFRRMMEEVVGRGRCSGCGACVAVCPYEVLQYSGERPVHEVLSELPGTCPVTQCVECDLCAQVCPRLEPSTGEVESLTFGRTRSEEPFGVHRAVLLARSRDRRVAGAAQDGGVVTALLGRALDLGLVDGALVSGVDPDRPWLPVPRVARSLDELLAAAGSRYSYSANPLAMIQAVSAGSERLALVGTPCEISTVGKARLAGLEEYSSRVVLTIGLLCNEAFSYEGLMEQKIVRERGVALEELAKVNIKGKVLVDTRAGERREIPLREAKEYARPECSFCPDFSAEQADLSAGGLGMDGWTLVVVRSDRGRELFDGAVEEGLLETRTVSPDDEVYQLLVKMSRRQRRRAERAVAHNGGSSGAER